MIQTHLEYNQRQLDRLKKAADEARAKVRDASPAYRRSAVYLDQWVQRNFRTEGGAVGGWEPFARGGRPDDGKIDQSAKLLQDTGALRLSFRPFATKKNAGIGSDLDYSELHEEGIGVPQRRMLPKREEVRQPIRDILDQYVDHDILAPLRGAFR